MEDDLPLTFLGYGGLFICFSLFFLSFWQDCSSQDVLLERVAEPTCRRRVDFWPPFFHLFSLILEARSTLPRRLLTDTRHPAAFSVIFRPCRREIRSCRSPEIGAWCPCAWELYAVWCACGPHSAFFRPGSVATGYTASDLHLGGSSVSACPSRTAVRHLGPFLHCRQLVLGGFCLSVLVFFLLFFWSQYLVFGSNFIGIFVG
jgi:hypothetical protein